MVIGALLKFNIFLWHIHPFLPFLPPLVFFLVVRIYKSVDLSDLIQPKITPQSSPVESSPDVASSVCREDESIHSPPPISLQDDILDSDDDQFFHVDRSSDSISVPSLFYTDLSADSLSDEVFCTSAFAGGSISLSDDSLCLD